MEERKKAHRASDTKVILRLKKHFKRRWQDYTAFLTLNLLTLAGIFRVFHILSIDLRIPLNYSGGDDMGSLVLAKTLLKTGGTVSNPYIGAPFGWSAYDYTSNLMHHFDDLVLRIIVFFVRDPALSVNLFYFSLFFMVGWVSYFVMRLLKVKPFLSAAGSLTFAFMPYIFMRGFGHIVLSAYMFVPLSILVCIWAYQEENFLKPNKSFFTNWKNWVAIVSALLIANNGIAYYAFFTCFFLCVTALSKWVKSGKVRAVGKPLFLVALVGGFTALNAVPAVLYNMQNGKNENAVIRYVQEAEVYGLKIAQLFLPVSDHGIPYLQKIRSDYNTNMPLVNENSTAYLGLAGILGFVLLLFCFLSKKKAPYNDSNEKLMLLSELNLFAVLFGTVGGFSSLFALLVTTMIRGYNRISIFIAYICILSLMLALDKWGSRLRTRKIFYPIVAVICLAGIWEQIPRGATGSYPVYKEQYESDHAFVQQIEAQVPEASMIFQLPYHAAPESGPVNNMMDYHLYIGYVHSDNLRWTYGAVKGREGDTWFKTVSDYPLEKLAKTISIAGYAGLYIDRRAYSPEQMDMIEKTLTRVLDVKPIYSSNQNLAFFNMTGYNERLENSYSQQEYQQRKQEAFTLKG